MKINQAFASNEIQAAVEYIYRQSRESHPEGSFDKAGRFYPSGRDLEVMRPGIRRPSNRWPLSYNKACRAAAHVAAVYDANPTKVRKAAYILKRLMENNPLIDLKELASSLPCDG